MASSAQGRPPRVFISYSHDSPEHKQRILELSERLRGIDTQLDQYVETAGPAQVDGRPTSHRRRRRSGLHFNLP
jgi:hypothetical protein